VKGPDRELWKSIGKQDPPNWDRITAERTGKDHDEELFWVLNSIDPIGQV